MVPAPAWTKAATRSSRIARNHLLIPPPERPIADDVVASDQPHLLCTTATVAAASTVARASTILYMTLLSMVWMPRPDDRIEEDAAAAAADYHQRAPIIIGWIRRPRKHHPLACPTLRILENPIDDDAAVWVAVHSSNNRSRLVPNAVVVAVDVRLIPIAARVQVRLVLLVAL